LIQTNSIAIYLIIKNKLFNKNKQRQFCTIPSTTIPNDQESFAHWLYASPETCKENQKNCLRYEDIRYSRSNPSIEKSNSNSSSD